MAYSFVVYTGDGSTTDFNVNINYLSRSHIHVLIDGDETTDFTWVSDTLIRLDDPADDTLEVKIQRQTPIDARLVDFVNGSTLNAETDLDQDSNQLFYLLQELSEGTISVTVSNDENAAVVVDTFTAGVDFTAGAASDLELSADPGGEENTFVTFDGVLQHKGTYSIAGTTFTPSSAYPLGVTQVEVLQFPTREFFYATLADGSVTSTKIADENVTEDKLADNSVSEDKIVDGAVTLDKLGADVTSGFFPIGGIIDYGGSSAPTGWQLCDGTALSRTTYALLFAVIGVVWGAGNGTTTFNVPDLRGRCTIGAGTGSGLTARVAGTSYGAETVTLDTTMIPAHSHGLDGYEGVAGAVEITYGSAASGAHVTSTTDSAGGGAAHANMQPSKGINKIIRII